jgi:hypothetical protein
VGRQCADTTIIFKDDASNVPFAATVSVRSVLQQTHLIGIYSEYAVKYSDRRVLEMKVGICLPAARIAYGAAARARWMKVSAAKA